MYEPKKYWNTLLSNYYSDAGVCWPQWPLSYNKWLHEQQKRGLETIFTKHALSFSKKNVFEIGTGNGFWSQILIAQGCANYTGFDIAQCSVERLQVKYPMHTFVECDFSEYRPHDDEIGFFDAALCVQVLLHIPENQKFESCLHNVSTMLKPDGFFIVLDAVSKNPLRGKHQKMEDSNKFDISYHNKVRSLERYEKIALNNGLELIAVYPAFNLTQNAFDFESHLGFIFNQFYFKYFLNPLLLRCGERFASLLGRCLVSIDACMFSRKSISSKWLVFRKVK